ncbi:hypothetical protein M0Q03_03590 [bacterium]|jgi:hypothetical protein|nr:hypothetical protein [bacterium]
MINRPDTLSAFFNEYLEDGIYCYWQEQENKIIICTTDDEEIDSYDMDTFENN